MKQRTIRRMLCVFLLGLFVSTDLFALTLIRKDKTGAMIYKCGYTCGKFKVIRRAPNIYRVYSIHFSGEVKADSFKAAARYACEKADASLNKLTDPFPSRDDSSC